MATPLATYLPASVAGAIARIKLLSGITPLWDEADIAGATFVLGRALTALADASTFSPRVHAIATLAFWTRQLPLLSGCVVPHERLPLSGHLARCVNSVWAHAPELLGADTRYWGLNAPKDLDKARPLEGRTFAEELSFCGVVLDPDVLHAEAASVLNAGMCTEHSIKLALVRGQHSCLAHIASVSTAGAQLVYQHHVSGSSRIGQICVLAATTTPEDVQNASLAAAAYSANADSRAARALLAGMANSGCRAAVPQRGWSSQLVAPVADGDEQAPPALRGFAEALWSTGCNGHGLPDHTNTLRDIGTIVGYGVDDADGRALEREFAGALLLGLWSKAGELWPVKAGKTVTNPDSNRHVAALIEKTDGASFMDRVLALLVEGGIAPDAGIAHLTTLARMRGDAPASVSSVLAAVMPPGVAESYAAMFRARAMADAIAAKTEGTVNPDDAVLPRRRRLGV